MNTHGPLKEEMHDKMLPGYNEGFSSLCFINDHQPSKKPISFPLNIFHEPLRCLIKLTINNKALKNIVFDVLITLSLTFPDVAGA